jgi:hypothetical protein
MLISKAFLEETGCTYLVGSYKRIVSNLSNKWWAYLKLLETRRENKKDSNLMAAIND